MGACLCKTKRRPTSNGLRVDTGDLFHSGIASSSSTSSSSSSSTSSSSSSTACSNALSRPSSSTSAPQLANRERRGRTANLLFDAISLRGSHNDLTHYLAHKNIIDPATATATTTTTANGYYLHDSLPNHRLWSLQDKLSMHAERLVIETLESIKPTALNEPSNAMQKLHLISETEVGWLVVIGSLINKVDLEHPFGSALILLILEDAPLPTKKSINQLDEILGLQMDHERSITRQRNISIVLGCLAEKLAGTFSSVLFSDRVQQYLFSRIEPEKNDPVVILYSLIALEKFSQTTDNKLLIMKRLHALGSRNPLLRLELFATSKDFTKQQVGFCANWDLDNYFLYDGRPYSYETLDRDNLNTMLNSRDASENLKISADGLMARNDTSRFESVRCTSAITSGIYYYEVQLITPGVMQIGFATKQSKFLNHDGFGIGDDDQSFAYDGCRQLLWQNAKSQQTSLPRWREGDVIGCLIDLEKYEIIFSLNGQMSEPSSELFKNKPLCTQYYAAASFMPFQQCAFNFGRVPFKYPPVNHNFRTYNQCATLKDDEKIIIPRHLILKKVYSASMFVNACNICCDNMASVTLDPCEHDGFCETCASLLELCPLCRTVIISRRIGNK